MFIELICLSTSFFILFDYLIGNYQGKYYLTHSICNFFIVLLTFNDVITLYQNPFLAAETSLSQYASILTYGLHFYHIIYYFKKLRFDDWLHHILMVCVALPLANYFGSLRILGHSLFYLTGFPGMIDYFLLFLVRNNKIDRMTEKKINRYLNIWIRCPGCIIHSYIAFLFIFKLELVIDKFFVFITIILTYWNGVYFMDQIVGNYYIEKIKN